MSSSRYNPEYHDDWAWSLCAFGATDQEVADAFGIHRSTLHRWRQKSKTLEEAMETSKEIANAKVKKSLYERGRGYTYEEVEKIIEHDPQGRPSIKRSRVTTKHQPADTGAAAIWLKNRAGWRDSPEQRKTIKLRERQIELQNKKLEAELKLMESINNAGADSDFDKLLKKVVLNELAEKEEGKE